MRNRLYVLDLGRMQMARSSFFGDLAEDDPGKNDFVEFPISAYLIEGPDGRILYDAGCHPDAMKADGRWSESFQSQFPWSPGPDGEACHLPNRLEQMGLGPDDIKHVVLSHMHSDHAGCVEFFRKSEVIVHRQEYDAALESYKRRDIDCSYTWRDTEQWIKQDMNWRFVENHETELSLTEQVTLLNWGAGHAAGMLGLDLSLHETGHIILASDAIFTLERYDEALDGSHRAQQYPISAIWAYMGELSTLGILGRKGNAREALERALNLQPDLSVGFIKLAIPITHEPRRDHFFDGLIKASVPE